MDSIEKNTESEEISAKNKNNSSDVSFSENDKTSPYLSDLPLQMNESMTLVLLV